MFIKRLLSYFFLKIGYFCSYRNYKNNRIRGNVDSTGNTVVLYDHECPLCRKEMERLKSLDSKDLLSLVSMNNSNFNEQHWGVSRKDASRTLHVLTAEKVWLVGMPAIRHVYSQVEPGILITLSGWPVFSSLADFLYRYIAPNRYVISRWIGLAKNTGKCSDNVCATKVD